jgi:GNAT superfamily N-acetyltransferase
VVGLAECVWPPGAAEWREGADPIDGVQWREGASPIDGVQWREGASPIDGAQRRDDSDPIDGVEWSDGVERIDDIERRGGAQRAEDADPPDVAIMIADDWQRHGVGKRLMIGLARRCIAAGVRRVQAETEAENVAAAALARSVTRPGVLPGCWEVGTSSMAAYRHLIFTYCG